MPIKQPICSSCQAKILALNSNKISINSNTFIACLDSISYGLVGNKYSVKLIFKTFRQNCDKTFQRQTDKPAKTAIMINSVLNGVCDERCCPPFKISNYYTLGTGLNCFIIVINKETSLLKAYLILKLSYTLTRDNEEVVK